MSERSQAARLPVPETQGADLAFGSTKHLPAYDTLPDDYRRQAAPGCRAVSAWFFGGSKDLFARFDVKARDGVDMSKAMAAIRAPLGSWEPKHEHKIAGCGWMMDQWFVVTPKAEA